METNSNRMNSRNQDQNKRTLHKNCIKKEMKKARILFIKKNRNRIVVFIKV